MPSERPMLLAVDGDGLLHRAFHGIGSDGERDAFGRPVAALRGMVSFVAAAAARLEPAALLVGFDCRAAPVRKAAFPDYKGHRPPRPPELQSQLDDAPELLAHAGLPSAKVTGYEADDVLASAAALGRGLGWHTVLLTSDRDSFALVDETTTVLRLGEGGVDGSPILGPADIRRGYGVTPAQYRDFAALRGDVSDNLHGVRGIGAKSSARLIRAFGDVDAIYAALDGGRDGEVVAVIGELCTARLVDPQVRERVARNRRLMTMYTDLPLPSPDDLRLPLQRARLVEALRAKGIGLASSLWALVGAPRPPWTPGGFDKAPKALPGGLPPGWRDRRMPSWEELRREVGLLPRASPSTLGRAVPARAAATGPARARRHGRHARPVPAGQGTLF